MICAKCYLGDQIKDNEMDGARGTCGEEVKCVASFGWGNLIEKDHLEDEGVNGRYKRKLILTECDLNTWSVSGKWQVACVNAVKNFQIS